MLESIDDKILKSVMKLGRGVVFLSSYFRVCFLGVKMHRDAFVYFLYFCIVNRPKPVVGLWTGDRHIERR